MAQPTPRPDGPEHQGGTGDILAFVDDPVVAATLSWSRSDASRGLRSTLLDGVHTMIVTENDTIADLFERAADLCGIVDGGGGTSHVDGGGYLHVLDTARFKEVEDRVDLNRLEAMADALPSRMIIVDEFNFEGLAQHFGSVADPGMLFLSTANRQQDKYGYQVQHGHLVLHHVAGLLLTMGFDRASMEPHDSAVRVTFEDGQRAFIVDLHQIAYTDFDGIVRALRGLEAMTSSGRAVVVLSWGLTGCSLRYAYELHSAGSASWPGAGPFGNLDDFATAVVATYDEVEHLNSATRVTRQVCEAVANADSADENINCDDTGVRILVGTTALHDTYAQIAEEAAHEGDAFKVWRRQTASGLQTTYRYYAAAGNQGLPYPLAPGSFPEVVAVAACQPGAQGRAPFSNAGDLQHGEDGEAIAVGAWFPSRAPQGNGNGDLGYWGTSFSAPLAALASGYDGGTAQPPTYERLCEPVRWKPPEH